MNAVTKTFDPYDVLNILRGASFGEIKQAYRFAAKTWHPDVLITGDAEVWAKIQRAYDVLSDPQRRKSYDDTGTIEDVKPDNDRASALQVIEMHMFTAVNEFLLKGQQPMHDPRKKNVIATIAVKIRYEIMAANNAIPNGRAVAAFWADLKARFVLRDGGTETENFFATRLDDQARMTQAQIADLERDVRVRERALAILDGYEFKFDQPQPTFRQPVYQDGHDTAW